MSDMKIWEDLISLNAATEPSFVVLGPARQYFEQDSRRDQWGHLDFETALDKDTAPLPDTKDREGYYGDDHFSYWMSGLQDANMLLEACDLHGVTVRRYFDIGCASGRVLRHFACQHPDIEPIGADINRFHVEWCNKYLPSTCKVFHNSSIPSLPIADNSIDAVTAYSVFTHIEAFETAWLMEISRILRPGGLAWITVHTEQTLADMNENWPLWKPTMDHPEASAKLDGNRQFTGDRLVLRWHNHRSYASNIFYRTAYIQNAWSRFMDIVEIRRKCPIFQDVVVFKKRS